METLLKAIKRPHSFRIKQSLIAHASPLLKHLTVRQIPGVETFRSIAEYIATPAELDTLAMFDAPYAAKGCDYADHRRTAVALL